VLDSPDQASLEYAKIRADLQKKDTVVGANDLFIAAHARSLGLTLVTNDTREFQRVPILTTENWTLGS
jgi:tRNA(fMet)-specific endonuclease VapC